MHLVSELSHLPAPILLELVLLAFLFCCLVVILVACYPKSGARINTFIERLRGKRYNRRAPSKRFRKRVEQRNQRKRGRTAFNGK